MDAMKPALGVAAFALSGCLLKPDKIDVQPADAHIKMDAPSQTLLPRLVRNAYFNNASGMPTPGMSQMKYQI